MIGIRGRNTDANGFLRFFHKFSSYHLNFSLKFGAGPSDPLVKFYAYILDLRGWAGGGVLEKISLITESFQLFMNFHKFLIGNGPFRNSRKTKNSKKPEEILLKSLVFHRVCCFALGTQRNLSILREVCLAKNI